jgi:23S rRNA pseudouridine1911/1915/1917 synthase
MCQLNKVTVNDKVQSKSHKVSLQDEIKFVVSSVNTLSTVTPENIPLDIIYEDEDLLAINKPNGMVVHPAVGSTNGTFVNALLHHLGFRQAEEWFQSSKPKQQSPPIQQHRSVFQRRHRRKDAADDVEDDILIDLPETPEAARASPLLLRPGIVHRIDKGTTGILVAAKHPIALTRLSKLFANRQIQKTYLAVCVGHPGDITISQPLARSPMNRQLMIPWDGPDGKPAISHVRTLCFDGKLSVVLISIETGRTHQIRVHLQHRRTPILGDATYGNAKWNKQYEASHQVCRPLLHAYQLQFVHPFRRQPVLLRAPLPADVRTIVEKISQNALSSTSSVREPVSLLDPQTNLLLDTVVPSGDSPTSSSSESQHSALPTEWWDEDGGLVIDNRPHRRTSRSTQTTPIITKKQESNRWYVPMERLRLDEDDLAWMRHRLLQEEEDDDTEQ